MPNASYGLWQEITAFGRPAANARLEQRPDGVEHHASEHRDPDGGQRHDGRARWPDDGAAARGAHDDGVQVSLVDGVLASIVGRRRHLGARFADEHRTRPRLGQPRHDPEQSIGAPLEAPVHARSSPRRRPGAPADAGSSTSCWNSRANPPGVTSSTSRPSTPSVSTSAMPPARLATTGVPDRERFDAARAAGLRGCSRARARRLVRAGASRRRDPGRP